MELPQLSDVEFVHVQKLMQNVSGIIMANHKKQLVAGRLLKRLKALGFESFSEYVALLEDPRQQDERRLAVDLLTTNETFFFREEAHFHFLKSIITDWDRRPLSIWSAACSSGEEVYSISMLLSDLLPGYSNWSLVGSDLCRHALDSARQGIYPMSRAQGIPAEFLKRYCLKGVGELEGLLQVKQELREKVSFYCINLNTNLPADLPVFDIIFLRNILIYFDVDGKRSIVERILSRLKPGGFLFIGHSESLYGLGLPLTSCGSAVYYHEPAA